MLKPAVLLDKDGTLLEDVPYNVSPESMRFTPRAADALRLFAAHGIAPFVVSNQSGVAFGRFPHGALDTMEAHLHDMFASCGALLAGAYWCPHHPQGRIAPYAVDCSCRKPAPGLLLRAAREHGLDLAASWFVGDILDDVEAGTRAGCRTILIDNGHETQWCDGPLRRPTLRVSDMYEAALAIVGALKQRRPTARASTETARDAQ